jgi:hypothetical protein
MAAALVLGLAVPGSVGAASEFYSWISPSGEMVLTDDAGKIPPEENRGPVSVHRYQDPPVQAGERAPELVAAVRTPVQAADWNNDHAEVADPAILEVADAFAEDQSGGFVTQYGWISLPGQAVGWSTPLYGFWSGRSIQNPLFTLQQAHLKKLNRGSVPAQPRAGLHRPLRERQTLLGTVRTGGSSAPCCSRQGSQVSGRRSGSRR